MHLRLNLPVVDTNLSQEFEATQVLRESYAGLEIIAGGADSPDVWSTFKEKY